jgi:hypothetical protein
MCPQLQQQRNVYRSCAFSTTVDRFGRRPQVIWWADAWDLLKSLIGKHPVGFKAFASPASAFVRRPALDLLLVKRTHHRVAAPQPAIA